MFSKQNRLKKKISLSKLNSTSTLSNIFAFVPQKTAVQILKINKSLSSSLNLTIDDYLIDKKYQKIILNSKGELNNIFFKCYELYNNSLEVYQNSFYADINNNKAHTFTELMMNIFKYLNYLYIKKHFKKYILSFDTAIYTNWMYFRFFIEVIRTLKCSLSLKINIPINYKYYEIIKDAIHSSNEINSVKFYILKDDYKKPQKYFQDYFNFCDWTKVKCLNFSGVQFFQSLKNEPHIYIPENANFTKLIIDDRTYLNINRLSDLILTYHSQIESLKIYGFNDIFLYKKEKNYLIKELFLKMVNIKKLKLLKCYRLDIFSFLMLCKKYLSSIKVLALDNVFGYNNSSLFDIEAYYKNIFLSSKNLKNLEKFEICFNSLYFLSRSFHILSFIINNNPNIKKLKIDFRNKFDKIKPSKNYELKAQNFLEDFLKGTSKTKNCEKSNMNEINAFGNLIKAISSLKQLESLHFLCPMNNEMTKLFNIYFNVGANLNYLNIIHSYKLDLNNILLLHPNLNKINFTLMLDENKNSINEFKYSLASRSWKSIEVGNYPLNDSFVDVLFNHKNTIDYLVLKDSVNYSSRSDFELNNILLEIKNKNL